MVKLNLNTIDPTLEAMRKAMEVKALREPKRGYLGASLIGNDCVRQIYYNYNGYPKEPFNAKTLMAFEDGHRTEDLTADRLRMVDSIELHTHKPDGGQYGFSSLGGVFRGHFDGVIKGILQAPKTWHVWECKSSNQQNFNKFKNIKSNFGDKDTLKNWNNTYFVQAQLYMHFSGLTRHYLTIAYSGGRDYDSCRTNYDKSIALEYIDRADKIIKSTIDPPRISENEDFYICKWCDYRKECHGSNK